MEQNEAIEQSNETSDENAQNVESTKTNDSHRLSTNSSENTYKLSIKDRVKEFNDNRKRKNMPRVHNLIIYHHKRERTIKNSAKEASKRIQYVIITFLVLLIILFLLYMFTPLSRISNIKISGNNNVSNSQVEKALDVKDNSRMYTYSKRKGIQNLKKNDLIKDVKLKSNYRIR